MQSAMTVSPELKALLKQWCIQQEEKYGPDWKAILAKEMSAQMLPKLTATEQYQKWLKERNDSRTTNINRN